MARSSAAPLPILPPGSPLRWFAGLRKASGRDATATSMIEFTEMVTIEAPPAVVWELMQDLEGWWPASNPDHDSLRRLDAGPLRVGTRVRIREKIAGMPGEATGAITQFEPGHRVTWQAPRARYRWLGLPLTISEGVTWHIDGRRAAGRIATPSVAVSQICHETISRRSWLGAGVDPIVTNLSGSRVRPRRTMGSLCRALTGKYR